MYSHCVVAEFKDKPSARLALAVLEKNRYSANDVSVVTPGHGGEAIGQIEGKSKDAATVPSEESTGLGALLGGTIATPLALTTLIGPLMVVGPLAGMAVGAVAGGWLGGADQFAVAEDRRNSYEQAVGRGHVLIIVHCEPVHLTEAKQLLSTVDPVSLEEFQPVVE